MNPKFFLNRSEFRKWLEFNHDKVQELWVGFYKKDSKKLSITYPESLDEALCFGWIDSLLKSIDEISYKIRFTPRKPTSKWSATNIKRVEELIQLGLMTEPGIKAFEKRSVQQSGNYSDAQKIVQLDNEYLIKIKANVKAWNFFECLPPAKKKLSIQWVMSAKKEETQLRRLDTLIKSSEEKKLVPPLIIDKRKKIEHLS